MLATRIVSTDRTLDRDTIALQDLETIGRRYAKASRVAAANY
jgi:hypothetical protein